MSELDYNRGSIYTGVESEEDVQATAIEIVDLKKEYEAMTDEEKARFPTWLRAQLEKM